ncbi:MAG: hypothetical protein ACRYHA_11915 [Janthinobacterium lividum]
MSNGKKANAAEYDTDAPELKNAFDDLRLAFAAGKIPSAENFSVLIDLLEASHQPTVAAGMIVMFSGKVVPDGWRLCDGNNGTPDLKDKFVLGCAIENISEKSDAAWEGAGEPDGRHIPVNLGVKVGRVRRFDTGSAVLEQKHLPYHQHGLNLRLNGVAMRNFVAEGASDPGNVKLFDEGKTISISDLLWMKKNHLGEENVIQKTMEVRGIHGNHEAWHGRGDNRGFDYTVGFKNKDYGVTLVADFHTKYVAASGGARGVDNMYTFDYSNITSEILSTGVSGSAGGEVGEYGMGHTHSIEGTVDLDFMGEALQVKIPYYALAFIIKL